MKTTRTERIREYYNADPAHEWDRFERHRFEFPVTLRHLFRFIEAPAKVLDIGGGPGRYSIEFAKRGLETTLLDLTPALVELAGQKADEAGVALKDAVVGDACDLSRLPDDSFDAALLFGPLYHLSRESDRIRAVEEALRVIKPGGILACAFISAYAPIFDVLRRVPEKIGEERDSLLSFLDHGVNIESETNPGFTDAYFIDPDDIEPFFDRFGMDRLALFGAEGLVVQSENRLMELDESTLEQWIDFAWDTSETKAGIYGSDHVVYIGKTPEGT